MARIVLIVLLFISGICNAQDFSDNKTCFIIADNVNIRNDSSLQSKVVGHANFGEQFRVIRVYRDWFKISDGDIHGYISNKFITGDENFLKLAEARLNKSGITMLALEKIYQNIGQQEKAENLSLEIMNTFKSQMYLNHDQNCVLYGETAFNIVHYPRKNTDVKSDTNYIKYCKRIIDESKDSFIIVRAMIQLAGAYYYTKKNEDAKILILNSLADFSKYIIFRGTCPNVKNSINTNFMDEIMEKILKFPDHLSNEMNKLCYDNNANIIQKAIACDILEFLDYRKDYR